MMMMMMPFNCLKKKKAIVKKKKGIIIIIMKNLWQAMGQGSCLLMRVVARRSAHLCGRDV
jgi:hypothetical protein